LIQICYLDAFSGLSGDMLVGALADAGADTRVLTDALHSLDPLADIRFEKTRRKEIGATKFRVTVKQAPQHRHLADILEMIAAADIPDAVKTTSSAVFQKLAEAESAIHQESLEKVHFHEVGAVDSIADIVGACLGFHLLGAQRILCSPVNVGSGTVKTEHGVLPVPAPATAALLKGKPVYALGPALELTTPTGAAVVATLAAGFGTMPAMTIRAVGYGAGDRDFREHANVLRVVMGETNGAAEATSVAVIEANIDDSTPQVLAYTVERLMAAGALDASLQPLEMKKGRPGSLLRVIATPETRDALADIIFAETSTLGVRIYSAERRVQPRQLVDVETSYGKVRVKVAGDTSFAPEYEDCRALAILKQVPLRLVLAAANQAYGQRTK
jgi:uncharacterized protein (TIGR00299 family) protein